MAGIKPEIILKINNEFVEPFNQFVAGWFGWIIQFHCGMKLMNQQTNKPTKQQQTGLNWAQQMNGAMAASIPAALIKPG